MKLPGSFTEGDRALLRLKWARYRLVLAQKATALRRKQGHQPGLKLRAETRLADRQVTDAIREMEKLD